MKARKRLLTIALTAALGLGVWTLAISFTAANFSEGDMLSAADLNNLLNGNFNAIEAEFATIDSAKLNKTGGNITGRTDISGAASSSGTGDVSTIFRVNNSSTTAGSAAVFQSNNSSTSGAVSVKQDGVGPALTLKSNGGGPLISGAGALKVSFIVEANGSIKIGDMGVNGTDDPTLYLNAVDGTITNNVGAGLPIAYGSVSSAGVKMSGTSNWTVTTSAAGSTYYIAIDGESYNMNDYVTVASTRGQNSSITVTANSAGGGAGGEIALQPKTATGATVESGLFFVVYKPGS